MAFKAKAEKTEAKDIAEPVVDKPVEETAPVVLESKPTPAKKQGVVFVSRLSNYRKPLMMQDGRTVLVKFDGNRFETADKMIIDKMLNGSGHGIDYRKLSDSNEAQVDILELGGRLQHLSQMDPAQIARLVPAEDHEKVGFTPEVRNNKWAMIAALLLQPEEKKS